jgi:hypothetical protein
MSWFSNETQQYIYKLTVHGLSWLENEITEINEK